MLVDEEAANPIANQQQASVSFESQPMNVELHSEDELQNEENVHSDSEVSTHGRDAELPKRDVHNDSEDEQPNMETRIEPRLSKYVRDITLLNKSLVTRKPDQSQGTK